MLTTAPRARVAGSLVTPCGTGGTTTPSWTRAIRFQTTTPPTMTKTRAIAAGTRGSPRRGRVAVLRGALPWVEGISNTIPEKVIEEDHQHDGEPRQEQPGELREDVDALGLGEQEAPAGAGLLDADAEIGEPALPQDHPRNRQRRGDDDVGGRAGEDVPGDHAQIVQPPGPGGEHELQLPEAEHQSPDDAGEPPPAHQAEHRGDHEQPGRTAEGRW